MSAVQNISYREQESIKQLVKTYRKYKKLEERGEDDEVLTALENSVMDAVDELGPDAQDLVNERIKGIDASFKQRAAQLEAIRAFRRTT